MTPAKKQLVVFVHGWSVSHTNTYGGLPERLAAEAAAAGLSFTTKEIFLGKYVSFRDEVRIEDISRAFEAALQKEILPLTKTLGRFACITHSTGGPVIRDWWRRVHPTGTPPMSHLIMLAPANFGSALAQLGKSRLSRIKTWFEGVEPGTGVLDWLELGSQGGWALNLDWIRGDAERISAKGVFPFVVTGQTIDRKLFDNLNSYTGELGSDGVVRVAAANLNASFVRLEQEPARPVAGKKDRFEAPALALASSERAPATAMRIVAGKSHSGSSKGIMRSVKPARGTARDAETVSVLLEALGVRTAADYASVREAFDTATQVVQASERLETVKRLLLLADTHFVHDRCSMVVFRVLDHEGHAVDDFDLLLTGEDHDPNRLPQGFFKDRQRNQHSRNVLTYYFDYDVMTGCDPVVAGDGDVVRPRQPGIAVLGFKMTPRPDSGFVHYLPCELQASTATMRKVLRPNETTLVDIVLRRIVREGVFRLDRGVKQRSFKNNPPGPPI